MPDATITCAEVELISGLYEKMLGGAQRVINVYVRGDAKQDEQRSLDALRKGLDAALAVLIDRVNKPAKDIDALTPALYARYGGVFCPVCLHSDLEYGDLVIDDPHYQEVTCSECGASWKDIYPLARYEDLKRLLNVVSPGSIITPVRATIRVSTGDGKTSTYATNVLVRHQYGQFSEQDVLRCVRGIHRFVDLVHYEVMPHLTEAS
jgi:hypothetical protein